MTRMSKSYCINVVDSLSIFFYMLLSLCRHSHSRQNGKSIFLDNLWIMSVKVVVQMVKFELMLLESIWEISVLISSLRLFCFVVVHWFLFGIFFLFVFHFFFCFFLMSFFFSCIFSSFLSIFVSFSFYLLSLTMLNGCWCVEKNIHNWLRKRHTHRKIET